MIRVRKEIGERYNDLLSDYATGDYSGLNDYTIIIQEEGEDRLTLLEAQEYFDIYTKVDGNHRVYDVTKNPRESVARIAAEAMKGAR